MPQKCPLGEFEHLLLLAVLRLKDEATAAAISRELQDTLDRRVSRGALYATLDRLEAKGFLEWAVREASRQRGGFPGRAYGVTEPGLEALRATRQAIDRMWSGLEDILFEGSK